MAYRVYQLFHERPWHLRHLDQFRRHGTILCGPHIPSHPRDRILKRRVLFEVLRTLPNLDGPRGHRPLCHEGHDRKQGKKRRGDEGCSSASDLTGAIPLALDLGSTARKGLRPLKTTTPTPDWPKAHGPTASGRPNADRWL